MDKQNAMRATSEIFFSGCGDGLGTNQLDGARNFVAEDLHIVPPLKAEPAFQSDPPTEGWLASGSAVLVCEEGTAAVHVDTRAGKFADRAEVKCEMNFIPVGSDAWRVVRTSKGVVVGHPHEISNKTVHWDFAYEGDGFLEQPADEYPRINPSRGDDGAALELVNRLGWT